ncbi:putative mannose-6-phosphate isomerase GmuF [Novipirellula galeiformis]|uniref:Putative mannose-6-phosphate isomerase GmuF n=1 Tax=Novipirellula galeiformis TaxID=2528004 RepID=A0A5C6CR86_9BACT|nr:type I phosphomannose isomerase catalytic subunit [Novipirellula galeiformis]TWU27070.1 putative mannose-6-phosphate isomerase GmuF [Novipirellula galeiformis]
MIEPYPLRFKPVLKQTLWGGRLLGDHLGKPIGEGANYAESWEVVDHGADQSIVVSGPLAGKSLRELLVEHQPWLMGESEDDEFPLLLKYLDCNRVLSVQVHPSDNYAAKMPIPDRGKTEAWYIVAAQPDSVVYAGLKTGVREADLRAAIQEGRAEEVLHQFHPEPGNCVFIPAGTVHALGKGLLVAEIQQSSDTTFRLFDWNRVDEQGNSRELHLQRGLEVTDFDRGPVQPIQVRQDVHAWQTLVMCDKFVLRAFQSGPAPVTGETFGDDDRFHLITVPSGTATLTTTTEKLRLATGDSLLLPAALGPVRLDLGEHSTALEMTAV